MSRYNSRRKVLKIVFWLYLLLYININRTHCQYSFVIAWNQWSCYIYNFSNISIFCWLDIWSYFFDIRIKNSSAFKCGQLGIKLLLCLHHCSIYTTNSEDGRTLSLNHLYILQHFMSNYNVYNRATEKSIINKVYWFEFYWVNQNFRNWKLKRIKGRIIILNLRMTYSVNNLKSIIN